MSRILTLLLAAALVFCGTAAAVVNDVDLDDTITASSLSVLTLENGSSVVCPSAEPANTLCNALPVGSDVLIYAEVPAPDTDAAALGAYQASGFEVDDGTGALFNDSWRFEGCVALKTADPGGHFIQLSLQQATVTTWCASDGTLGSLCSAITVGTCAVFAGEVPDSTSDLFGIALIMRSVLVGSAD